MVDHETLLHRTKQARAAFEEAQADADAAKQDYHERVRGWRPRGCRCVRSASSCGSATSGRTRS